MSKKNIKKIKKNEIKRKNKLQRKEERNQKYLFENFKNDKRTYNLNQIYWKKKFLFFTKLNYSQKNELFKNTDGNGQKLYDGNPIFSFLNNKKNKALRVIQIEPDKLTDEKFIFETWKDSISIELKNKEIVEIEELVIYLNLSKNNLDKALEIIVDWFNNEN